MRLALSSLSVAALLLASLLVAPSVVHADGGWRELLERFLEGRAPSTSRHAGWSGGAPYALDVIPRRVAAGERVDCPSDELVRHRGTHLRYAGGSVRVHREFVPRLERFEALVRDMAIATYGRAPRRILHAGTYACRRSRGRTSRISEHALGNALDLSGLQFGPLPRDTELPEGLHRRLRWRFDVRVARHWEPRSERDAVHADFLHRLTDELSRRPDIFRGIVGPPRPRHHDHLHLDAAPWRYHLYRHEG